MKLDLNRIFGRIEFSSRWVPCTCGNRWCGHYMNRCRDIGRDGTIYKDEQYQGVGTVCDGNPPKPSLMDRFWKWVGR